MMTRPLLCLLLAEVLAMSLWFSGAAVLAGLRHQGALAPLEAALLTSLVQAGFVAGGLMFALTGFVDRLPPVRIFVGCALLAAAANAVLLVSPPASAAALASRFLMGAALAGVYPVGMTIAVSFGVERRGLLVGLLVGALTLGSAMPHLAAGLDVQDWRLVIAVTSVMALVAALLMAGVRLGAHHHPAAAFSVAAARSAWRVQGVRTALFGYLGHMWELYAFWAWIGTVFALRFPSDVAAFLTFIVIALGAVTCVFGGLWADRLGKARVARMALLLSGLACLATAVALQWGSNDLLVMCALVWGAAVIPDSPQFSALVADHAPAGQAGSLLVLQTALGFALTAFTVQIFPFVAEAIGWPGALALLALGPAFGLLVMRRS